MDLTLLGKVKRELEREIADIQEKLGPLEELLARRREQLDALDHLIRIEQGDAGPAREMNGARTSSITTAAFEILADRAKPAHYTELLELLNSTGVAVSGRQPGTNLIAHLSRDARFTRVGNGVYGLKEWGMKPMPKRRRAKRSKRS